MAESRSDLSAESCDDRQSRHDRCRRNLSSDETVPCFKRPGVHRSQHLRSPQLKDVSNAVVLPEVPIPQGLQQPSLTSTGSLNFSHMNVQ